MATKFEQWQEPHDPSDTKPFTYRFALPAGVSITAATVTVVDDSDTVIAGSTLSAASVSYGLITATGNVWGVTFYPTGGTAPLSTASPALALLRCRITTNASPIPGSHDRTMRLFVQQT